MRACPRASFCHTNVEYGKINPCKRGFIFRSTAKAKKQEKKHEQQDRPTNPNAFYEKSVKDSYYRLGSTARISDSWQRFMSATLFVGSCGQVLSTTLINHARQQHETT